MPHDDLNQTTHITSPPPDIAQPSASMHLTVFDGAKAPQEYDLSAFPLGTVSFGRDQANDIVIESRYVSRRHGQLRFFGGRWHIGDLQSTNGLIFAGQAIQTKALDDGDILRIDDGVETTGDGVLLIFSFESETAWQTFPLADCRGRAIRIGRDADCDIILDHISVSKHHAIISEKDGIYYLGDQNSTNGVSVNGKRIHGRVQLHEKDMILITNSKLIFSQEKITYCCFKRGISVDGIGLVKKVGNNKIICDHVDLAIVPGEMVAIIGGSGAGKSTLMNCLCGYSKPTAGMVSVNGVDLYENYQAFKSIIAYVPQSDIVYDNLTVHDMLKYAARLRLPSDISEAERNKRIEEVIAAVELSERKDTLIKKLSGGQRKRASIAVELMSDPNLFFLDEPASGLDPGTERNLVRTLRKMCAAGKTVVFVTHSTLNLHLCDRIAFMGTGGLLCFYGSHDEALDFFGVSDIVDVYNLIGGDAGSWHKQYRERQEGAGQSAQAPGMAARGTKRKWHEQLPVLFGRNLHILSNDRLRLLLLIAQAPLLALLISLVANGDQYDDYRITKSLLFALSCSAFWIGILNAIQEVCRERNILKREYMTCLRLDAYILAKILAMAVMCAIQSFLLVTVFALMVGLPPAGVLLGPYAELLLTTFLTALAAAGMGLFVSSLFKNTDRAMTVAPLLLMPQLLFSGLIFELSGATEAISFFAVCRWSMEGYGTTANLNSLDTITKEGLRVVNEFEAFFEFNAGHQLRTWFILLVFAALFAALAALVLRGISKEH